SFQEGDGIRACHVTGVQTCALPISILHVSRWHSVNSDRFRLLESRLHWSKWHRKKTASARLAPAMEIPLKVTSWNVMADRSSAFRSKSITSSLSESPIWESSRN